MPGWLVTGSAGFLGRHILDAVQQAGYEAIGSGRLDPPKKSSGRFAAVDLEDFEGLSRVLAREDPDVLLHAAGRTPPGDPGQFARANTLATLNLLEAARLAAKPMRVVLVGSAAELGPVAPEDLPVGEDYPCRPVDAYGRSKWLASMAGLADWSPLAVMVARVFNPIGPGLPRSQAFGRFAATLAEACPGPVRMQAGDLDTRRDFLDARDVAAGLLALALRGHAGEIYHLGRGHSRRVGEGLDLLIQLSGREVRVETSPDRRGPTDSRADPRKIQAHTGWRPEISWEQSLSDLWDEARETRDRPPS